MEKMKNEIKTTCIYFSTVSIIIIILALVNLILFMNKQVDSHDAAIVSLSLAINQLTILGYLIIRNNINKHNRKIEMEILNNVRFEEKKR